MNYRLIGLGVTSLVLVGSVSLLQWHGIMFWQEKVGPHGWAWSLLLECVALWLWYRPSFSYRTLALVASVLTLAGPIYQVAKPTFIESYSVVNYQSSNQVRLESLAAEKARLTEQLAIYQDNSTKRTGWLEPITKANDRIIEIDNAVAEIMLSDKDKQGLFFSWTIFMEVVSLVLFQIVAVLSITSISRKVREIELETEHKKLPSITTTFSVADEWKSDGNKKESINGNTEVKPSNVAETPLDTVLLDGKLENQLDSNAQQNTYELIAMESAETKDGNEAEKQLDAGLILKSLNEFLVARGMNFSQFSEFSGVSAKEISFLRHHEKRLETGQRTVSIPALEKIYHSINSTRK